MTEATSLQFSAGAQDIVSGLLLAPKRARAVLVLAHGAGAGMQHPFMESLAQGLAQHDIASLRFQFPYMEKGMKRPDTPAVAMATVRFAIAEAARRLPGLALFAGGKSFGGRMSAQAQAVAPLAGVQGLVFVGFPLHPAGQPAVKRAEPLARIHVPMLFLQGTRDALADLGLIRVVLAPLGDRATVTTFADADHSFHVRKSSGTSDEAVMRALIDGAADWMLSIVQRQG